MPLLLGDRGLLLSIIARCARAAPSQLVASPAGWHDQPAHCTPAPARPSVQHIFLLVRCRLLDSTVLLALEAAPVLEELAVSPAFGPVDLAPAWSDLHRLLSLLLHNKHTRPLALACGAGAAFCRALSGGMVSLTCDRQLVSCC